MSPVNTLLKFIKTTYHTYRRIFAVIVVKCLVYAMQTLYAALFISAFLWCIEQRSAKKAVLAIGVLVTAGTVIALLKRVVDYSYEVHKERMKEKLDHLIFDRISRMPYRYLEDPVYLDLVSRARFCIKEEDCIDSIFRRGFLFLQNLVIIVTLSASLLYFHAVLFGILVAVAAVNVILYLRFAHIETEFFNENLEIDRKYMYYMDTLLYPKYGKDFRFYPVGELLVNKFADFSGGLTRSFSAYSKKVSGVKSSVALTKYAAMGLSYVIIFADILRRKMSVSSFSFYISASVTFLNMITESIENMMRFFMFLRYADPLIELLSMEVEETGGEQMAEEIEKLEFQNITFGYPNASEPVLKNVSFQIHRGEKISIVGLNGAGKTTIVKLICRLYEPDAGDILVNGTSIYRYDYESYIQQVSTLFQDFRLFAFSLKENMRNGKGEEYEAGELADMVGLKARITALPQGLDSIYSKDYEEGGVELSGGEQQKLALARMLNKKSSLMILDEPTAAMDPYAEAAFYDAFNKMVGERMTIYISHRMSASVFADKILVIEKGQVADFDTHANLLKKRGRYQELFQIQADHYEDVKGAGPAC